MKKYSLFGLIVLALFFTCNRPSSDEDNSQKEQIAMRSAKKSKLKEARRAEYEKNGKADTDTVRVKSSPEKFLAEISGIIELTDEQKKTFKNKTASMDFASVSTQGENKELVNEMKNILFDIATPAQLKKMRNERKNREGKRSRKNDTKD